METTAFGVSAHKTKFEAIFYGQIKCLRRPFSHRDNKKDMMFECKSRAGPVRWGAHGSHKRVETQRRCVRVVGECIKFALTFSLFLCIRNAFNVSTADVVDWSCSPISDREGERENVEKKKMGEEWTNQRRLRGSDWADNHLRRLCVFGVHVSHRNKTFVIESFVVSFVAEKFVDNANSTPNVFVCICFGHAPCYFLCCWRRRQPSFH